MIFINIFRLLYSEYTSCPFKAPKVITEQPLASSSAEPSSEYCWLYTTLSKKVVQSSEKTGEKQWGRKQDRRSRKLRKTDANVHFRTEN